MMMKRASACCRYAVGAFCCLLVAQTALAAAPHPAAHRMMDAARWWVDASRQILQAKLETPVEVPDADSARTGLIGVEFSATTTTLGSLHAKQISANPDFAALMVRWLWTVGAKEGDTVAVSMSGSFPALDLAVYAAIETMHLHAVIIASLGASSWGANQPDMTWADMERVLLEKGLITHGSTAMTVGGTGDWGGGILPEGKEILLQKIQESRVPFLEPEFLAQAVAKRLLFYGELGHYRCFINVGGAHATLGRGPGARSLPTGLLKGFPKDGPFVAGEVDGVIFYFLRQGVPVIHLLEIHKIARRWGISTDAKPLAPPGKSPVYFLHQ
jgi:poly-gamma-glutamate system protein